MQEQHYLLQAQLARVESEADALQWQAQQAAREARQLRRGGPPTQDCGLPGVAPMDADGPAAAQQQGSHGAGARPQPQASHDSSAAGSAVAGTSASPANGSVDGAASEGGATTAGGVDHSGSSELPPAVADAALAEVVVPPEQGGPAGHPGMYGPAPPHESFDELLVRFQAQVRCAACSFAALPLLDTRLLVSALDPVCPRLLFFSSCARSAR